MTDPDKVENRYRSALHGATPGAQSQASSAGAAFSSVLSALTNEAWVSTTADTFSKDCSDMQTKAGTAGDDSVAEMTSRYSREPAKVDPSDYRATWY